MLPKDDDAIRSSRLRRLVLGKNARARYWLVVTWRTLKTTLLLRLVQLPSWAEAWTKLTRPAASQAPAAEFIALTTVA
jgi:hypothetical protein